MRSLRFILPLLLLAGGLASAQEAAQEAAQDAPLAPAKAPLDDYLQQPDAVYRWELAKTVEGNPSKTFVILLTSQAWRTEQDVDRTAWEHWVVIVKPEKLTTNKVLMMISGGGNDGSMPGGANEVVAQIAAATGSVGVELRMVPNQPLVFHGDGQPRKEDDLIGYGWNQFLETGDATWLPRLPMVKSAVRAMDCVQEFLKTDAGGNVVVERFVVAGGSKRGWTTWLTGAADKRGRSHHPHRH